MAVNPFRMDSVTSVAESQFDDASPELIRRVKDILNMLKKPDFRGVLVNLGQVESELTDLLSHTELPALTLFKLVEARGRIYFFQNRFPEAARDFLEALERLPEEQEMPNYRKIEAEIYKYLALLSLQKGAFREAAENYQKGWEIFQTEEAVRRREKAPKPLALSYIDFLLGQSLGLGNREAYQKFLSEQDDLPDPLPICERALQDHPKSLDLSFAKIQILRSLERIEAAKAACIDYLRLEKQPAYQIRGLLLASDICMKVRSCAEARLYLKEACVLESDVEKLVLHSKKLLELELADVLPKDVKILSAALTLATVDPKEALKLFEQISLSYFESEGSLSAMDRSCILLHRAKAYLKLGSPEDLQRALESLMQAKDALPKENRLKPATIRIAEIYCCFAEVRIQEGKMVEAKRHFQKGWDACREDAELAFRYVTFLISQKAEEAEEVYRQAVVLNGSQKAYLGAKLYFMGGKSVEAIEACKTFLSYRDTETAHQLEILDLLQKIYMEQEQLEEAYHTMIEAYRLDNTPGFIGRLEAIKKLYPELQLEEGESSTFYLKRMDEIIGSAYALIDKKPQDALKIFHHIFTLSKAAAPLNAQDLFRIRVGRAKACLAAREGLAAVRSDLNMALAGASPSEEAEVCCCLGRICIWEKKYEEAEGWFERGWKAYPADKELVQKYILFLVDRIERTGFDSRFALMVNVKEMVDKALRLCRSRASSLNHGESLYFEAKVHFASGDLIEARRICLYALKVNPSREAQNLATLIYLQREDYEEAERSAKQAYERSQPIEFIQQSESYVKALKARIIDQHLWDRIDDLYQGEKSFTIPQKIAFCDALLDVYVTELHTHIFCRSNILYLRGQLEASQGRFAQATQDYGAALAGLHPRSDFCKRLEEAKNEGAPKQIRPLIANPYVKPQSKKKPPQ